MVRIGVIGIGNMGSAHVGIVRGLKRAQLTAVCDIDPTKLTSFEGTDVKGFADSAELIRSGLVDAVTVATPHYFHTTIGVDAMNCGIHTLVEKPVSVHKSDVEKLIAAHAAKPELVFAAMFNQRTDPHYQRIKRIIDNGELGKIQRMNWIITDWFRPEAYYASGGWRATWAGEGGGVLLNQCPHNLDLWQWLFGMPKTIRANAGFGKYHDIEVEDEVTAYMEYENGATGVFITTTGEAPGTNRLEVVGDRGKLVYEGSIKFIRTEVEVSEFNRTSQDSFGAPPTWTCEIPVSSYGGQHTEIMQNFVDAILDGKPLIAKAEEGINSAQLANAMIWSAKTGKTVDIPLDGVGYEAFLKGLIADSKFVKKEVRAANVDMSKSWTK